MKGVLPKLVCWARSAGTTDFCPALAALVSPVQNIISSPRTLFHFISPSAQQPGQAVVLGRLSLCLWYKQWHVGKHVSTRMAANHLYSLKNTCVKFNHIKKPVSNSTPVYLKQKTI